MIKTDTVENLLDFEEILFERYGDRIKKEFIDISIKRLLLEMAFIFLIFYIAISFMIKEFHFTQLNLLFFILDLRFELTNYSAIVFSAYISLIYFFFVINIKDFMIYPKMIFSILKIGKVIKIQEVLVKSKITEKIEEPFKIPLIPMSPEVFGEKQIIPLSIRTSKNKDLIIGKVLIVLTKMSGFPMQINLITEVDYRKKFNIYNLSKTP